MIYGFQLGREFKLSIAEILSVFSDGEVLYSQSGIMLLDGISGDEILSKIQHLGGTIKVFECSLKIDIENIYDTIINLGEQSENKFTYSINIFGEKGLNLQTVLKTTKKLCKDNKISARYCNKFDDKNLSSAQILGNNVLKKGYDFNIVNIGDIYYFGKTIWVQDIDAYSKRDYGKQRDMQVGMLPPKLSQMMINLASSGKSLTVYDPFVGLGTILIESLYMGNTAVYGSDLSDTMVITANTNIKKHIDILGSQANYHIEKLNAKFINESDYISQSNSIVTEGYLGEVMTQKNISTERIARQRENLEKIYSAFFKNLSQTNFDGTIVISFPFWEIKGKYHYFNEIYSILEKYCTIYSLFPDNFEFGTTKHGSLLYKRGNQLVGREIFKLTLLK